MGSELTAAGVVIGLARRLEPADAGKPGWFRPKDAALALSLSNLIFLPVWSDLIGNSMDQRASYGLYSVDSLLAAVMNVLFFGVLFHISTTALLRTKRPVAVKAAQALFWLFFFMSIGAVVHSFAPMQQIWSSMLGGIGSRDSILLSSCMAVLCISARTRRRNIAIGALLSTALVLIGNAAPTMIVLMLAGLGLLLITTWRRTLTHASSIITLVLFPFVPMTLFQAGWMISRFHEKTPASLVVPPRVSPRIIWVIFDGLDFKITFEQRPAGLELPELDRLRSNSLFALNAYPPADFTIMSMPSLISGRLVSDTRPENPSSLMVTFGDSGERVSWASQPSVFSEARGLGVNGAIVGWYHPYCRIIGDQVTSCMCGKLGESSLAINGVGQFLAALRKNTLVPKVGLLDTSQADSRRWREQRVQSYREILQASLEAVSNPELGLVLLHLPVPHPPGVFNRTSNDFDASGNSSYLDNLKLADNTLGQLRRTMENAGLWEDAVVVVSTDHWWRGDLWRSIRDSREGSWTAEDDAAFSGVDERIPFLVKLAHQNRGFTYAPEFNTVLTHDMFLALLSGSLSDAASVVDWLDTHRTIGRSPYKYKAPH